MHVNDWTSVEPLVPGSRHVRPRRKIEELDDVKLVLSNGWELIDGSPLWDFLPAVWPQHLCGWLPDSLLRTLDSFSGPNQVRTTRPWSESEYEQHELERAAFAEVHLGLKPLPTNRLWFVRSPEGDAMSLNDVCELIWQDAERRFAQPTGKDFMVAAADWLQRWR